MAPTETEIDHFLELYATRNFTRAAMRLGIAQPTLTQSIFRIEQKTKSKLFHRTKQGCAPTEAGVLFYNKAQQFKDLWQSLSNKISNSQNELTGVFKLGCHQSVGAYTLPHFFKQLAVRAPSLEIRLHHDWSRKITEKIVNYELDFGIVINPIRHRDLVLIKLGNDKIYFWKAKGVVPPKQIFADANLQQVENILGKHGMKQFVDWQIIETASLELIRTLTSQGAGVGILPERVAGVEKNKLEIFKSTLPTRHDEIYLVYRVDMLRGKAGKVLVEIAKNCLVDNVVN